MSHSINASVALEQSADHILTVWFDSPHHSVNVLDDQMLSGLEAAVEHAHVAENNVRAVVFRSRKPRIFFAGADVHAIAQLESQADVRAAIERGQQLMQSVESLPMPTVAAIDGMCMGGGLEFALSCDYRIASDSPKTLLGLPEIKLGLIPGWGGTQRLPKRVGTQQAIKLILSGSPIAGTQALRCGLVDQIVTVEDWEPELDRLMHELAAGGSLRTRVRSRVRDWFLDRTRLGRRLVLRTAKRKIAAQERLYPATTEAIRAVGLSMKRTRQGYDYERDAFTRLRFTPTARNLLELFFQRDRAKKLATWIDTSDENHATTEPLQRLAVIGAGAMGAGIGTVAVRKGYHVVLKEISEDVATAGRQHVEELLDVQVQRRRLRAEERQAALDRLEFTSHWDAISDCDLAIEAVLEIPAVKREVFAELDQRLRPQAILASNTSSLSVTAMASATGRRAQVAGLHFFNPVDRMELVEVVRTEATSEATVERLIQFVKSLGKVPIVTSDKPGFLVNRVLFPYLGEAVRMVSEGILIAEIDREMRNFGMPLGPLELIDQVGVDIASHVASSLRAIQPDAEQPAIFLQEMADNGYLGKKSKMGFYEYPPRHRRRVNRQVSLARSRPEPLVGMRDDGFTHIQRRLVYPLLNEAAHCLDELVVSEAWMVDLGMALGTGFAPMRGGPLRLIDTLGPATVQHNLSQLQQTYGDRFIPADSIQRLARQQSNYFQRDLPGGRKEAPSEVRASTSEWIEGRGPTDVRQEA